MKDIAYMIADIYMVGPLTYPKVFQCDTGSKFKAGVTKLLKQYGVMIQYITTKYRHTHTAFIKALNKLPAEDAIEFAKYPGGELSPRRLTAQGRIVLVTSTAQRRTS